MAFESVLLTQEMIDASVAEAQAEGYHITQIGGATLIFVNGLHHMKLEVGQPLMVNFGNGYVPFFDTLNAISDALSKIADQLTFALNHFWDNIPVEIKALYSTQSE